MYLIMTQFGELLQTKTEPTKADFELVWQEEIDLIRVRGNRFEYYDPHDESWTDVDEQS